MYIMLAALLGTHLRRAADEQGVAATHSQGSQVEGVEAVHILLQADGIQDGLLVDVLGKGELHQDAVHLGVCIVPCHHLYTQHCSITTKLRKDEKCDCHLSNEPGAEGDLSTVFWSMMTSAIDRISWPVDCGRCEME